MRLSIIKHLQAVLNDSKQLIGLAQGLRILPRNSPILCQQRQCCPRIGNAQGWNAPTVDQLMGLGKKFAFPNATPAPLQIISGTKLLPCVIMIADLARHLSDIGDLAEIQTAPPDEGLNAVEEIAAKRLIPRRCPCADKGGLFPSKRA